VPKVLVLDTSGGQQGRTGCGAQGAEGDPKPTRSTRVRARHVEDDDEEAIMKIRPLHDRIVVKRLESENRTKGGIIIPDSAKEKPIEGRVVAVGNGKLLKDGKLRPLDVAVGDVVLFGKYAGNEVKIDGEAFVLLREDDLLAVTEPAQSAS
jgi:chaperonin GroES